MTLPGRTGLFTLFALLLFIAPAAQSSDAPQAAPTEKTRFEYARSLYVKGAYDSAVKEFEDFVRDFPKGAYTDDALYWLGVYKSMAGDLDGGLDEYKTIVALLPTGDRAPAAQLEVANYWSNPANPKHDYEKAVAEYLKLPYFYPESPLCDDAAYYAALCQIKAKNYSQAESELRAFIEKWPGSEYTAPAAYQLGMACLLSGKTDEALVSFQTVRDNHPEGLYRGKALGAIELIMRARSGRPLKLSYAYGSKGSAPGQLNKPQGVALGPEGAVYVSDTGNGRLARLKAGPGSLSLDSASIVPQTVEKGLRPEEPSGVAAAPDGSVLITDSALRRVQVFSPEGGLVLTFGKKGQGAGEFSGPAGIALDDGGNIYVADPGGRKVNRYDPKGRFTTAIAGAGASEENQLRSPAGIAIDIEGNIIVADSAARKVYRLDRGGRLLGFFGGEPQGRFRLSEPVGVAVDGVGNVYVCDKGGRTILVLDRDLKPVATFPPEGGDKKALDSPAGIAVTDSGEIFIADQGASQILVVK